ncbi:MAG: hypothetical protein HRT57_11435 [Crocinitomicaceae bacterium]|nr:hypothetical protein [Crocinitomicaceae bacterium]
MKPIELNGEQIIATIDRLEKRIGDRFPDSGLRNICNEFLNFAKQSKKNIQWIGAPNIPLRFLCSFIILIGLGGLFYSISFVDLKVQNTTLETVVTISEAVFNDILLLGASVFFLVTMETRLKRKRALKALNQLRVAAHVIDMYQLTKDPMTIQSKEEATPNSPSRTMSRFELQRYLDYCSECTALIAKIAALYSQSFPDEVVVRSVNEIEVLSTGLSRKIWQKIVILDNLENSEIKRHEIH